MGPSQVQLAEWKEAYRLLNVPEGACPQTIKTAYRKLIKRCHPDRYPSGTIEQHDASRMSQAITAAYAAIYHAPLSSAPNSTVSQAKTRATKPRRPGEIDWLRFWTRFAFGALLGSLLGLRYLFYRCVSIPDMTTSIAVTTLFWGIVARNRRRQDMAFHLAMVVALMPTRSSASSF